MVKPLSAVKSFKCKCNYISIAMVKRCFIIGKICYFYASKSEYYYYAIEAYQY